MHVQPNYYQTTPGLPLYLHTSPCSDPTALSSRLTEFTVANGVFQNLTSMDCKILYKSALKHLLSKLFTMPSMFEPLVSRLSFVEMNYPDDLERYVEELEKIASDLSLLKKGPGGDELSVKQEKDKSQMLCMSKREGRPCKDGLKCKY